MGRVKKFYYRFRRKGAKFFTYNCVFCKKAVRGSCICEECAKTLEPAVNRESGKAAAYYYENAPKAAVLLAKFHKGEYCIDTLVEWMISAYNHFEGIKFDFAVPVPSFEKEKTLAFKLADEFCTEKDIPMRPDLLFKIRKTNRQHDISAKERRKNLIDAFKADSKVKGKTVLLIDDIITTGATAFECSKALIKSGASRVCVLTVLKSAYDK